MKVIARKCSIILLFCYLPFSDSFAQQKDSLNISEDLNKRKYYKYLPLQDNPDTIPYDTNIVGFNYIPVFAEDVHFFASAGNTGTAARNLESPFRPFSLDDVYYRNAYNIYTYNPYNTQIIRSERPLSEWYYSTGAAKRQVFKAIHAQNIGKGANIGLDFHIINAAGSYLHQHAKNAMFSAYAQYRSENNLYSALLIFNANRVNVNENFGLLNFDADFKDTTDYNRQLAVVNNNNASNTVKLSSLFLRQEINLDFRNVLKKDSNQVKKKVNHKVVVDAWFANHKSVFYDDNPKNPIYPEVLVDSFITNDSVRYQSFITDVSYKVTALKKLLHLSIGLRATFSKYGDSLSTSSYIDAAPTADLKFGTKNRYLFLNTQFRSQQNIELSKVAVGFFGKIKKRIEVELAAKYFSLLPYFMDKKYNSNHFSWNKNFVNEEYTVLSFSMHDQKNRRNIISVKYINAAQQIRYVEYNPYQLGEPIQYLQARMQYQISVKNWHLMGVFSWQNQLNNTLFALNLPEWLAKMDAGYRFPVYENRMQAMIGMEIIGIAASYADKWLPVIRVFSIQNTTKLSSYVYVSPYLNLRLKRTRFMLKYDHANAGLFSGYGATTIPDYPMHDGLFTFAVSWRFMD